MAVGTLLEDEPIRIVRGAIREYDLFSYDATVDEEGSEITASRARSDLTSAVITATFERADETLLFTKVSSDTAQIEIHADQVTAATKGSAILKFIAADTSALVPGTEFWYYIDAVYADGRDDRLVKRSRFHVDR